MAKNDCIKRGCQMAKDGAYNPCPTGTCIDDKAFSAGNLPTAPLWRMPIANVFSNDAAFGIEWAHNGTPPDRAAQARAQARAREHASTATAAAAEVARYGWPVGRIDRHGSSWRFQALSAAVLTVVTTGVVCRRIYRSRGAHGVFSLQARQAARSQPRG